MNFLKEIGIATIVISFSFIGFLKTYRLKRRLENLENFSCFLHNVKSEIAFQSLSLHQIITSSKDEFAKELNKHLVYFTVPKSLKKACESYFINEEDKLMAVKITEEFGKYDSQSQVEFIDMNIEKISKIIENQTLQIKEKAKVNLIFYSFLGIAIALVLI